MLNGANRAAVRGEAGWEMAAFTTATPLGGGEWRLTDLLRGLQGSDADMREGAPEGAVVVFLDETLERMDLGRDERGLSMLVRAGPFGAPPGGADFVSQTLSWTGVHDRPWTPARLSVEDQPEGGLKLSWTPRRRLYGDSWDADREPDAGLRFRIRLFDGDLERRAIQTEARSVSYPAADQAADFPDGLDAAIIEVCEWGADWGWGPPARRPLIG